MPGSFEQLIGGKWAQQHGLATPRRVEVAFGVPSPKESRRNRRYSLYCRPPQSEHLLSQIDAPLRRVMGDGALGAAEPTYRENRRDRKTLGYATPADRLTAPVASPSVSVDGAAQQSDDLERVLQQEFPDEVETIISKTGQPENATDPWAWR